MTLQDIVYRFGLVAFSIGLVAVQARAQKPADKFVVDFSSPAPFQQVVTVSKPDVCFGRLIELMSEQSGVALHYDARNPLSGTRLAVDLKAKKIGEVMECLQSMFSYKKHEWHWYPMDFRGKLRYELRPDNVNDQLNLDFERQSEAHLALRWRAAFNIVSGKWTPEQAAKETGVDPLELGSSPARVAFVKALTAATGSSADKLPLQRGESIKVDIAKFSNEDQETIGKFVVVVRPDKPDPIPVPSFVEFTRRYSKYGSSGESISAMLDGKRGGPFVGGFFADSSIDGSRDQDWRLPADQTTDPVEDIITTSRNFVFEEKDESFRETVPDELLQITGTTYRWFQRLFHGMPTSFIARKLANEEKLNLWAFGVESRVGDALIGATPTKWRNRILLATVHNWFLPDQMEQLVPWQTLAPMEIAAETKPWIDLRTMMKSLPKMTEDQRKKYCHRHPECLAAVAHWKIFSTLAESELNLRQAVTERGGPISDNLRAVFNQYPYDKVQNASLAGDLVAIRYMPRPGMETYKKCKEDIFTLQVKSRNEGWITVFVIPIPGIKYRGPGFGN
ncbi:MAG: hypothetical protein ABJA67_13655 [Chthonomonadales bacterium]